MTAKTCFLAVSMLATAFSSSHAANSATAVADSGKPQPKSPEACIGLQSNNERLACYDAFFNPISTTNENNLVQTQLESNTETSTDLDAAPQTQMTFTETLAQIPATISANDLFGEAPEFDAKSSLLDRRWELAENSKLGNWQIRAHQPVYILPVMWTSDKNNTPYSPNPTNQVNTPLNVDSTEAKFQISFKTKAVEDLLGNNGDVWIGYTQSSRWQVYNSDISRPFRETNYEPEASLIFRTNYSILGLHGRLLGATLNHQSNGRSDPVSRSWNRVMLNIGLERDNFALMLRPWYRISEDAEDDNNPDIKNYVGRGDLTAFYKWKEHNFSVMLRHSFKGGDNNRGAIQFDWAFPLKGSLRGHLQLFEGYGESLIDYNHKATYVGLGLSLMNWY